MRVRFPAGLLAIVSVALLGAGCGSTRVERVVSTMTETRTVLADGGHAVSLPPARNQNQCQVAAGPAEIIFFSEARAVAGLCRAKIAAGPWRSGAETLAPSGEEFLVCYLRSGASTAVVSVFDTVKDPVGRSVCAQLRASGQWATAEADPGR